MTCDNNDEDDDPSWLHQTVYISQVLFSVTDNECRGEMDNIKFLSMYLSPN